MTHIRRSYVFCSLRCYLAIGASHVHVYERASPTIKHCAFYCAALKTSIQPDTMQKIPGEISIGWNHNVRGSQFDIDSIAIYLERCELCFPRK